MLVQPAETHRPQPGFTLLELLLALFVVGLVSAITLASFRVGGRKTRLMLAAERVALDLRRAQVFASATRQFSGVIPCGYGVVFNQANLEAYTFFAELDSRPSCSEPFIFSSETERVEDISFDKEVELAGPPEGVSPGPVLTVFFLPPAPLTLLTNGVAEASITLTLRADPGVKKKIVVRQSGEIRVAP